MQLYKVIEVHCEICGHNSFTSLRQPYYWHECDTGNVCHVLPTQMPKAEHVTLKEVEINALRSNKR